MAKRARSQTPEKTLPPPEKRRRRFLLELELNRELDRLLNDEPPPPARAFTELEEPEGEDGYWEGYTWVSRAEAAVVSPRYWQYLAEY